MNIQITSYKILTVKDEFDDKLNKMLSEELIRYRAQITGLEVRLSDVNGFKEGHDDKKCFLEVRLEGRQPIAVFSLAHTYDLAVNSAIDKLRSSLENILGRVSVHHRSKYF
ncbi:MAG: HPF/RaiA family ribosome-associated protein [Crocinitomicaceae bacterium]